MTANPRAAVSAPALGMGQATAVVPGLGLLYTALYTVTPDDAPAVVLHLLPGLFAVAVLLLAGLTREQCFLRPAPPSWVGLLTLALFTTIGLAAALPAGEWVGWRWRNILIYAPLTALAQELYFRAALLPLLLTRLRHGGRAVSVQAVLFMAWHLPKAAQAAPLWGVVAVAIVALAGGVVWGRQVRRDGTILYVLLFHALVDMGLALAPPA